MSGVVVKTVKGGEERTIVLKRVLTKLKHCDGNSAWAAQAEIQRIASIKDEGAFQKEFNASLDLKYFYLDALKKFAVPCIGSMGGDVLKELLMQRVPTKLSGWIGFGIKIVYRSKKKRGLGIEIRYKGDGDIEVWKIEETTQ